ncbi:MAG: hypothetical protein K1X78_06070 [Verrucomicrobiaceae bacterium]|nr:hypothetical protein [Verrucomicrobiaceae bacterium]
MNLSFRSLLPALLVALAPGGEIGAHPADNSQARFKIEPRRVDIRLTFNLYTLQQFYRLDANSDGRVTRKELDSAEQALQAYLRKHVLVTINEEDTDLGQPRRMERMWPDQSAGADVAAPDYGQRFVDFIFVREWSSDIESVWIGFDIFKETGDLHVVAGVFEQDGVSNDVSFSRSEPEYLWDTGFTETKDKKPAATAPPPEAETPRNRRFHPLALIVGFIAIVGTWLLLGKVRRISRGGFRIGPPPERD